MRAKSGAPGAQNPSKTMRFTMENDGHLRHSHTEWPFLVRVGQKRPFCRRVAKVRYRIAAFFTRIMTREGRKSRFYRRVAKVEAPNRRIFTRKMARGNAASTQNGANVPTKKGDFVKMQKMQKTKKCETHHRCAQNRPPGAAAEGRERGKVPHFHDQKWCGVHHSRAKLPFRAPWDQKRALYRRVAKVFVVTPILRESGVTFSRAAGQWAHKSANWTRVVKVFAEKWRPSRTECNFLSKKRKVTDIVGPIGAAKGAQKRRVFTTKPCFSRPQKQKMTRRTISCESGEENAQTLQHILEKSPCFAGLLSTSKVTRVRSWGRFARENTCFFHVFLFHTVFCEVFLAPFSRSFHVRFSQGPSAPFPAGTPPKKALSTRKETLPPPRSRVQGSRGSGV